MPPIPLKELAERINAHLERWEADPKINTKYVRDLKQFYSAGTGVAGRYVTVQYIGYQGSSKLTRAEAEHYLKCIEEKGFIGRHFEAFRKYPLPKEPVTTTTWYCLRFDTITPVQIEKATDSFVWINGRRIARQMNYESYYPTWDEAYAAFLKRAMRDVQDAQDRLANVEKFFAKVEAMKKPGGDTPAKLTPSQEIIRQFGKNLETL